MVVVGEEWIETSHLLQRQQYDEFINIHRNLP